jgi:hypothetical protein
VDTVVLLILLFGCVIGAQGVRKDWRATIDDRQFRQPSVWPYGDNAWFSFRKINVVGTAFMIALTYSWAFPDMFVVWGPLMGASVALMMTVIFFNWPRVLVPPALRQQGGLLTGRIRRL